MQNQRAFDAPVVQHVFVTVSGGVAYVASAPEAVKVHVIDYDNIEADFEAAFRHLSPEAQAFYRQSEEILVDIPRRK